MLAVNAVTQESVALIEQIYPQLVIGQGVLAVQQVAKGRRHPGVSRIQIADFRHGACPTYFNTLNVGGYGYHVKVLSKRIPFVESHRYKSLPVS
jgi:hypothetical protein